MIKRKIILFMGKKYAHKAIDYSLKKGFDFDFCCAENIDSLYPLINKKIDFLISFGSGTVIPERIVNDKNFMSLNIHAGSPEYPGRDPHHFAIYNNAKQYGATLHLMHEKVDSGPIIDIEIFNVPKNITPDRLLGLANKAGWKILKRFFKKISEENKVNFLKSAKWGKNKTTRKMFYELCNIPLNITEEEFKKRLVATSSKNYNNLFIDIYGHRFRIQGKAKI
jgi:methionyl-tRNA formyltransferase